MIDDEELTQRLRRAGASQRNIPVPPGTVALLVSETRKSAESRSLRRKMLAGIGGLALVGGGIVAAPAAADVIQQFLAQTNIVFGGSEVIEGSEFERLLEELPRDARGAVVLAAPRPGLGISAASPEGVRVRHVDLSDPSARQLIPHLEPLLPASDRALAWLAGESALVTDLRRWLVAERGMAKARVQFTGYWRRGVAAGH